MSFKFSFHSIILATFALGTLLSCGGGGGSDKGETPYVLPEGTTITLNCGEPKERWITLIPGAAGDPPPTPQAMDAEQTAKYGQSPGQVILRVTSNGLGTCQFFGQTYRTEFRYTRTSATSFNLTISWNREGSDQDLISFEQCELPKSSSEFGSLGQWTYTLTIAAGVLGSEFSSKRLVGGGSAQDTVQYITASN